MRLPKSLCPGRLRAFVRRPPLRMSVLAVAAALSFVACGSDPASSEIITDAIPAPDDTAVAPGACDPTQSLAAPVINTGGSKISATLGLGEFGCSGLNGDGYISFNYNPVLIEGEGSIEVTVGEGVTATITWAGDQQFTESSPGVWTSSLRNISCSRLTIGLSSESGSSAATYGADIRVGGRNVDCPQREVDPSDPSDSVVAVTNPPPPTATDDARPNPVSTAPATTAPRTSAPTTTTPRTSAPATTEPVTTAPASTAPATTEPVNTAPATTTAATEPVTTPAATEPVTTPAATTQALPTGSTAGP